jgi:hypothetical protein
MSKKSPSFPRRKTYLVYACFVLLLAAAVIGGRAWSDHRQQSRSQTQLAAGPIAAAHDILVSIGNQITASFSDYSVTTGNWIAQAAPTDEASTFAVPDYSFKISTAALPRMTFRYNERVGEASVSSLVAEGLLVPKHPLDELYHAVVDGFKSRQFTAVPSGKSSLSNVYYTSLKRNRLTCNVVSAPETTYYVEVSCTSPELERALAAKQAPFVHQYTEHKGLQLTDVTVAGPLTIKSEGIDKNGVISASARAGYDLAELLIVRGTTKTLALYYAKHGQWHYITEAADEFGFKCSDIMKDSKARTAMYDQICMNDEYAQVRVDSDRRALQ